MKTAQRTLLIFILLSAFNALQLSANEAQAQGLFNIDTIPAPPQSTKLETRKEQSDINLQNFTANITHYQSPLSPDVIVNFYKQNLPEKGWQLLGEGSEGSVAMATFTKEKENVSISAYTLGLGQTDIYISRSQVPQDALSQLPATEQGQDTPGKDFPWAPRYPGAVRKLYQQDKQSGVTAVTYAVNARPEEIVEFYQYRMPENGWRFVKDVILDQLPGFGGGSYTTLFFQGFRGQCQVSINKADDFQGLDTAAILINYIPEGSTGRM